MRLFSPQPNIDASQTTRWWRARAVMAGLFLGIAALALSVACGAVGDACLFDSDCSGGSLCVREVCHAACSVPADCEPPYDRCLAFTREDTAKKETVKICVSESFDVSEGSTGYDCKASGDCCTRHSECVELFDSDAARCGPDARCLIPLDS